MNYFQSFFVFHLPHATSTHLHLLFSYSTRAADSFSAFARPPGRSSGLVSPLRFLQLRRSAVAWWLRTHCC